MDSEKEEVSRLVEELEALKSEAEKYRKRRSVINYFWLTDVRLRYSRDYEKRLDVYRPHYQNIDELMSWFEIMIRDGGLQA